MKEEGAAEKLAPFIIFLFSTLYRFMMDETFPEIDGVRGAPQFSQLDAAFNSI